MDERWSEHKTPAGRSYYHEATSNKTVWRKPDALLTPAQLATGWSETSHTDGRKYWYDKADSTKTSWTAPAGWSQDDAPQQDDQTQLVSSSFQYQPREDFQRPRRDEYRPSNDRNDGGGYRGPVAATPAGIEYRTPEEAEAAFNKLMKRAGVQVDWTWDQAMRATITDPAFRAIKDPPGRKDAFHKFIDLLRVEERQQAKEREAKFVVDFRNMLARHAEIKHYTRWKTALPHIEHEAAFKASEDEAEKQRMFREYIVELQHNHSRKQLHDHQEAIKELSGLMKEVTVSPDMKWSEAQEKLKAHSSFSSEEKYKTLTKSEILDAFVEQIRKMWDDVNTHKQRERMLRSRTARKAREAFRALLGEMQDQDRIGPETMWKEVHGMIKDDIRYTHLIETCRPGETKYDGSTPQDIFFDLVDDLDYEVDALGKDVDKALRDMRFKFGTHTTEEELMAKISSHDSLKNVKKSHLKAVYKKLKEYAAEHEEEAARDRKRQQRKAIDVLRSRIKRLEPPVKLDDTWDQVRDRVKGLPEYTDIDTDGDRRAAYDKHMLRLQDDAERERAHRQDRDRRRRPSGSPPRNGDAYEADRRRAIEQRERQYRHASGGLSPIQPKRLSRDDGARFDRERRERDADRERAYVSRADPYAKTADLDYGDDGGDDDAGVPDRNSGSAVAASKRERRTSGSEVGKDRANKRAKTVDGGKDEDTAMQSGSEEGEIEEVTAEIAADGVTGTAASTVANEAAT